nr:hypothetical protein [Tanacetum cinerariifolium]
MREMMFDERERENVSFDLTKSDICSSFIEDLTMKGVGLHVGNSHTSNHREDNFMPLETIRRFLVLLAYTISISFLYILCDTLSSKKLRLSSASLFTMVAKDIIRTKTCVLIKEELFDFFTTYPIPSKYKVMLPKSNQTIFDASDGYVGLYTHCFSLANIRLPLSRHNPSSCAKQTTFGVMCKAYAYEPSVDLFRGFFDLFPGDMAFRNFLYAKTNKDLTFLPKDPSPEFGTGSPSASINTELPLVDTEPAYEANTEQNVENVTDYASREDGLPDVLELQDSNACHLNISNITHPDWRGHLDNQLDVELLDLHDCCYARQAIMDNVVNRRARELLKVVEQIKGECDFLMAREKAGDKECEELKAKCKAAMMVMDNNPNVKVLHENIVALLVGVKEHKASLNRMLLESAKAKVVLKVVPYISMKLVHIDELGMLVGKLVSSAVFYERCATFEKVAEMKEPFDLTKKSAKIPSLNFLSSFKAITCGTLNLHMTCSHANSSACLSFATVTGLASTHLVEFDDYG